MENVNTRKLPIRRCMGCGEHFPKNTLCRVLKTPEGEIVLDLTGKKNGRGAYICKEGDCREKFEKQRAFERAFKGAVPQELKDTIKKELI